MENLKSLFVPFEIAKLLKEKGFDETCFASYANKDKIVLSNGLICNSSLSIRYNSITTAPIYQQVVDWFEEKHQIFIKYDVRLTETYDYYGVVEVQMDYELHKRFESEKFPNKNKALSKAIEDALTLLVFMTVN